MLSKGVRVDDVWWSGFWLQGDGAWFGGRIVDYELFMSTHNIVLPTLLSALQEDDADAVFCSSNRHGNWMSFNDEFYAHAITFDHPLKSAAWEAKIELAEKEWESFCIAAKAIFRDAASELYRQLEAEYEYLTSDEEVLETLIANDHMEGILDEYEPCGAEEDYEGEDAAPLRKFLLRPTGAVLEVEGEFLDSDVGDGRKVHPLQPDVHPVDP